MKATRVAVAPVRAAIVAADRRALLTAGTKVTTKIQKRVAAAEPTVAAPTLLEGIADETL
jgi:hypothetical protein